MKTSELLIVAAEELANAKRLIGMCSAIARTTKMGSPEIIARSLLCELYLPDALAHALATNTELSAYWFGPLDREHRGARVLALLFAAEVSKDFEMAAILQ